MRKDRELKTIILTVCALGLMLSGCSAPSMARESAFESAYENGTEEEQVDIYTSAASVIIEAVNEDEQTISMYLTDRHESRDFHYNNATSVQDKFGSALSVSQLNPGDIADITYNSELERAGSISLAADSWSYEGVEKYNLNAGNGNASIGDEIYSLDSNVQVFSEGEKIDAAMILRQDVLTLRGKGHNIMSITVEKGHGYLDLVNDDALLGGWVEVGQAVISPIAPDMLLTVPEGSYTVRITGNGAEETREVEIQRNRETKLDLEDIKVQEVQKGIVSFKTTPESAKVYVDDILVDTARQVKLPLGLHLVTAQASGYDSLSRYFQIEAGMNVIRMELSETVSVSDNQAASDQTEHKQGSTVTVAAPAGVEVYQDNLYMGVAPVTYQKTAGERTITLRKAGYVTRSYMVVIPDDSNDVTYSFPELDPEGSTVSGNSLSSGSKTGGGDSTVSGNKTEGTVSGNSVSGNSITDSNQR